MSDLSEFDGDLVEALGPDFEVGMSVSCDKCLAGCWGFDQFRLDDLLERDEPPQHKAA